MPEPGTRSTTVRDARTSPPTALAASAALVSNTGPRPADGPVLGDVDGQAVAAGGAHDERGHQVSQRG